MSPIDSLAQNQVLIFLCLIIIHNQPLIVLLFANLQLKDLSGSSGHLYLVLNWKDQESAHKQ